MSERSLDTSKMTDVLDAVGFKSDDVSTQAKVTNRLKKALVTEGVARDQQRVLCYLLSQMGLTAPQIVTSIDGAASVNTVKTRIMEGTVMVLTNQPVLADQVKYLEHNDLDSVKSLLSKPTKEENAERFLQKAVMDEVRTKYTKPDGKTQFTVAEVDELRDNAVATLEATSQAVTPANIVSLVTNAEDTKDQFVKKAQGPDDSDTSAKGAPKTPAQHFKAALKDAQKIAEATPDQPMTLTPEDAAALFDLIRFYSNASEVFSDGAASIPTTA